MLKINKKSGFTLVELLVYVSTASIVILIIASVVMILFQSKSKSSAITEVEQQGNNAMKTITQLARNAEGINIPTQGVSTSTLSLDVYDSLLDPTVISESGGVMQITEGGGSAVNLTSSNLTVSNLDFTNLSKDNTPGIVRIEFTLTKEANNRGSYFYEKTFYTSVSLR